MSLLQNAIETRLSKPAKSAGHQSPHARRLTCTASRIRLNHVSLTGRLEMSARYFFSTTHSHSESPSVIILVTLTLYSGLIALAIPSAMLVNAQQKPEDIS